MASLAHWIEAARPKTLIAILAPLLIGAAIALTHHQFEPVAFFWMMIGGISLQMLLNFANDYYDGLQGFDTPKRIGPKRMTSTGTIPLKNMRFAMLSMQMLMALSLWGLFSRGGLPFLWLALTSWLLAIFYSKEPICLSRRGLGEIFVFVFFGPVATCAAAYTYLYRIPSEAIYLGVGCGLISTAILAAANLRDIDEDRSTGKRTLAVRFGFDAGRLEIVALLLSALIVSSAIPHCWPALIALFLPLAKLTQTLYYLKKPQEAVTLMPKIALFLALYTLSTSLCLWIFSGR